jgi:hypothetical protein
MALLIKETGSSRDKMQQAKYGPQIHADHMHKKKKQNRILLKSPAKRAVTFLQDDCVLVGGFVQIKIRKSVKTCLFPLQPPQLGLLAVSSVQETGGQHCAHGKCERCRKKQTTRVPSLHRCQPVSVTHTSGPATSFNLQAQISCSNTLLLST